MPYNAHRTSKRQAQAGWMLLREAASGALAEQEQDRWPGPPVPSTFGAGMLFCLCHRLLLGIGCTKSLLAGFASTQNVPFRAALF